MAMSQHILVLL